MAKQNGNKGTGNKNTQTAGLSCIAALKNGGTIDPLGMMAAQLSDGCYMLAKLTYNEYLVKNEDTGKMEDKTRKSTTAAFGDALSVDSSEIVAIMDNNEWLLAKKTWKDNKQHGYTFSFLNDKYSMVKTVDFPDRFMTVKNHKVVDIQPIPQTGI